MKDLYMKSNDIEWSNYLDKDEKLIKSFSVGGKYLSFWFGFYSLTCIIVLIIGIVLAINFGFYFLIFLSILGFLVSFVYYKLYLKAAHKYALTETRVISITGWVNTNTKSIEYNTITDIRVMQNLVDRLLTKTANVEINTAGAEGYEMNLMHIDAPYEVKNIINKYADFGASRPIQVENSKEIK